MDKDFIFSIDLGGTTVKLAIIKTDGEIIEKWEIPTNKKENGKWIVDDIYSSFMSKIKQSGLVKNQFTGVGMGAPGPFLPDGTLIRAVNIGLENYPLKQILEETFSLPAFVENDANCAALGEMWQGAGKGLKNLICITLGTGVGGGIIANGRLISGITGGAGEIGHITVRPNDGYVCNCGKTGCLETVASATGIVRTAEEYVSRTQEPSSLNLLYEEKNGKITAKDVFDLLPGDKGAEKIVDRTAYYLGSALGTLSTLLNPEAIVIGGGVSRAGDKLLTPVKKYYEKFAFPPTRHDTKIIPAKLGNDAGVFGAAYLVMQNVL